MNKTTVSNKLISLGINPASIEYGWSGGPFIHIHGTDINALLPMGDEDDEEFAKWIANQIANPDICHP